MTAKRTGSKKATAKGLLGACLAAIVLVSVGACTAILNRDATQCQSDNDCTAFGGHPYCQSGVCVSSGLGPSDCFYGSPQQPGDFLNQCSNAQCLSFDNCSRLGLCTDAGLLDAQLTSPATLDSGASVTTATSSSDDAGPPSLPSCYDPNNGRGQVIYMTGSSNFPPLLAKLSPLIVATGYVPVYLVTNSCTGVSTVFSSTASAHMIADPPPTSPTTKYASYYDATGTAYPCTLGSEGVVVDVGESDIFSSTCEPTSVPGATIGEYLGPIQAMVFAVPGQSLQTAITAEAAREVFGMGGGNASPWTNPDYYYVRNSGTGTQQMIGHAIGVPAAQFWGSDRGSATAVDTDLRNISDPATAQLAIGIISADWYDSDRGNIKALAYKATEQDCAYLPDSDAFKKDKQNVRDGHYPIWGPVHFFTAISGGNPVSPGAQAFVGVVSVPNLAPTLVDAFIGSSLIPSCAMSVQRSTELGPLSTYTPPYQCYCHFQASPSVNGVAPAGCTPCSSAVECTNPARPACNLGYCEVQ